MYRLKLLMLACAVWIVPMAAWSAMSDDVRAIPQSGDENVAEQLVDFGAAGSEQAATVMETVARERPRLLPEVVQGLAFRLEVKVFDAAVEVAVGNLENTPASLALLRAAVDRARRVAFGGDDNCSAEGDTARSANRLICETTDRIAPIDGDPPIPTDPPASPS